MTNKVELVVISGRSGSGKTVALHALEDLGFYFKRINRFS